MSYYSDQVIRDGAVAYWRLGETSGTQAADSIGTNHGTISGGVTLGQPGALADGNTAMAFDGMTGRITTTKTLPLPVTIEVWLKTSTTAYMVCVSNRDGATANCIYCGLDGLGKPAIFIESGASSAGNRIVTDNQFHHLVYIVSGTQLVMYVDGTLDTSAAATVSATVKPMSIGVDGATTQFFYSGSLDDVAIYPTALTPAQIANHYGLGRLTTPYGSSLDVGILTNLVQSQIYSLPSRVVNIESSSSVEISVDGVSFIPLTNPRTSAAFIRTLNPTCKIIAKYRK